MGVLEGVIVEGMRNFPRRLLGPRRRPFVDGSWKIGCKLYRLFTRHVRRIRQAGEALSGVSDYWRRLSVGTNPLNVQMSSSPGAADYQRPHHAAIAEDGDSECQPEAASAATIVDMLALPTVDCPCGVARRALAENDHFPGTLHITDISATAVTHYHRRLSETYLILTCSDDAALELDGRRVPVKPLTAVVIPPGVRHRALGTMRVAIICTPAFDPHDEHFD